MKKSDLKVFFSSFFYYMCNIVVLILYIKSKVSLKFVLFSLLFFPPPCCIIIYLYSFFLFSTPVRVVFFSVNLMCGCPRGLMRGTDSGVQWNV